MTPYLYAFVREDLSIPQQIIQTAHAVDELNKSFPHDWQNHMVLFSAKNEDELLKISQTLHSKDIHHELFFEPDINQHTAIATQPLRGDARSIMKKYKLKHK